MLKTDISEFLNMNYTYTDIWESYYFKLYVAQKINKE